MESHAFLIVAVLYFSFQIKQIAGLSTHFPPIQRVEHISQVDIKVLPRQRAFQNPVQASLVNGGPDIWWWSGDDDVGGGGPSPAELRSDDSFLMSLVIPSSSRPLQASSPDYPQEHRFTLFLQPTTGLLHPQARITYGSSTSSGDNPAGATNTVVALAEEDILAYSGWVIKPSGVASWWAEQLQLTEEDRMRDDPSSQRWKYDSRVLGWARILVHQSRGMRHAADLQNLVYEGSFEASGDIWHIKTLDSYNLIRRPTDHTAARWDAHPSGGLIAWHEAAVVETNHDLLRTQPSGAPRLQKRQSIDSISASMGQVDYSGSIGSTEGCPTTRKVVYMGIAADCTYISEYGSQDAARLAILNNLNTVSALFERSFNVSLAIVELKILDPLCPPHPAPDLPWNIGCPDSTPEGLAMDARLSAFSQWRGQKGGSDGAGLWHLMTACPSGQEVGVAWMGTLCKVNAEGAGDNGLNSLVRKPSSTQVTSGTGVTSANPSEWQVMAHEIGHNFGAIHDCSSGCSDGKTDQCCPFTATRCSPDQDYIMTATSSRPTSSFSACTIGNVCTNLKGESGGGRVDTSCLSEPGAHRNISLHQCGNGIVDPGEDCDPGDTPSACCQWGVCKFAPQAVCDPLHSSCCTPSCQLSPSGTVCRPVSDPVCDVAETCSGRDAQCPADSFVQNGLACGPPNEGLSCAAGKCTSRDRQCQAQDPSLGLKQACDPAASIDCRIACKDPNRQDQCIVLEANFQEGSPCGCGGFCSATGTCVGGNQRDCGQNWREVSHDSF